MLQPRASWNIECDLIEVEDRRVRDAAGLCGQAMLIPLRSMTDRSTLRTVSFSEHKYWFIYLIKFYIGTFTRLRVPR